MVKGLLRKEITSLTLRKILPVSQSQKYFFINTILLLNSHEKHKVAKI